MRRFRNWRLFALGILILQGCATLHTHHSNEPLPHFVQVDKGLYRGGQPSLTGIQQLATMGIKTIVNLRGRSRVMDEERVLAEHLGMRLVNIPIWTWWRPSHAQIQQFLAIVEDPAYQPVFVHCRLGKNRAGVMVAIYRIAYYGWKPERAYTEARQLGLAPWNPLTRYLILREIPRASPMISPSAASSPKPQKQ